MRAPIVQNHGPRYTAQAVALPTDLLRGVHGVRAITYAKHLAAPWHVRCGTQHYLPCHPCGFF